MRIVIDMQGAQTESRFRGIGRYTLGLARAIARYHGRHDIVLALSGLFPDTIETIRATFDNLLPQMNIRVWHASGPIRERDPGNAWRRQSAELIREAFLLSLKPDIVHIPSLFEGYLDDAATSIGRLDAGIPVSATVHDLIPLLNSAHYLATNPRYEKYYRRKLNFLRQASLLLAVSESSRREAITHLSVSERAVINTSEGLDDAFQPLRMSEAQNLILRARFRIDKPFVLYTGGSDERKNLFRLIRAYGRLPDTLRTSHCLILAGKMPDGDISRLQREASATAGLRNDELRFTGYVTDVELVQLYNLCKLFVFPSWHEGFGLPALEAMRCGAPVIGANTSSLPEVIGLEAALFDPFSEESLSAKIAEALYDNEFRDRLKINGKEQARRFSWKSTAERAVIAFEELLTNRKRISRTSLNNEQLGRVLISELAKIDTKAGVPPDDELRICAVSIAQSLGPDNTQRQLFVDVSELVQRDAKTGVQRVTRSILCNLLERGPIGFEVQPVYASTENLGYRYAKRFSRKFLGLAPADEEDEIIEAHPGDIFIGLDLQAHVVCAQRPILERMYRTGVKLYFVVHDILPITMPHYFDPGAAELHKQWLRTIHTFDGVVCVSRTVANEVETWLSTNGGSRLRPFKICWSHNGADLAGSVPTKGLPENADSVLTELKARPSFLMVGTIEPRKGHAQVLSAFDKLWSDDARVNLVVVGKQGWKVDAIARQIRKHARLGTQLFWLDGISDEYLENIYTACTCLIAASEGEGFGLPLIEAAQHRLPIIARDIPVFREVASDHAYFFHGRSPTDLTSAILHWLRLYEEGNAPKSEAMTRLTWFESTQTLLQVLLTDSNDNNVSGYDVTMSNFGVDELMTNT